MVYSITAFLHDSVQILYLLIGVFKVIDFFFSLSSLGSDLSAITWLQYVSYSLSHESYVSNTALTSGVLFSPRELPEFLFFFSLLNIKYMKISLALENVGKWNHSFLWFQNCNYINNLTGQIMINT